ncbi:hypothetical protein [Roseobacter sinensis]|uniref:Uncharacterized protein n=1 Tax=Roseobacter sinensis TaxID=2931391 RepID=A0ABT3BCZ7_9RHOB|nr:hypothetical protein [Roseobacter sp. WL0113]MCV3271415.1 hypothetical protein [Roseobacter sp. WL0113]
MMLLVVLFTKAFFVVLFGLIGTAAGYVLHNLHKDDNPIPALRSVFGVRRSHALALGSVIAALIALMLFLEGIGASPDAPFTKAAFTCGAYGFFAFSLSSYVFGRQALSRARRKLARAGVEQTHIWQRNAEASRKKGGAMSNVF